MLGIDAAHMQTVTLQVGEKMLLGHEIDTFALRKGATSPDYPGVISQSGNEVFDPVNDWVEGPPKGRQQRIDFTIFETDIPPQHHWLPRSKNYRVLWRKSFLGPNPPRSSSPTTAAAFVCPNILSK